MKCSQCGTQLPNDTKFCVQCGAPVASSETTQPTVTQPAEAKPPPASKLKKRSVPGVYIEAVRLYFTNLLRYGPAILAPALLIYFLEPESGKEIIFTGGFVVRIIIQIVVIVLLSGVLGHITAHIYVHHKADTWDTLKSAMKLVPAEFFAGIFPAFGAAILLTMWLYLGAKGGVLFVLLPIWAACAWAISILASIVVESEGIKNPFKAIVRGFHLLNVRKKLYTDGTKIVLVVILNMAITWVLSRLAGIHLLAKLVVEPVFEIVYGLLYFNLRFMEGNFDIHVLARELGVESSEAVLAPAQTQ